MTPNSSQAKERRHSPRIPCQAPVTLQKVIESRSGNVFEVQGQPESAQIVNLSEEGLQLKLPSGGSLGKILKLNIPVREEVLDVFTKVAWQGDGTCGLQFVAMGPQVRKWVKGLIQGK
mgnify:CR=1 FL=1